MVTINNSELTREIIDVTKLQAGREFTPNTCSNQIVPVIDVNPKHSRIINYYRTISATASGTQSVTLPADKDFYLTNVNLSISKNATCDIATGKVVIIGVLDGDVSTGRDLLSIGVLTLTAESSNAQLSFPIPVKLSRGSNIQLTGTYAAGAMSRASSFCGFLIDNINA
jgi:hypothetical protein